MDAINVKPVTHQANLAKLPRALAPLIQRRQWAVWRWVLVGGKWTKPPFQARNPQRHASTKDPSTWCDYATALAAVEAGQAEGVTYMLTESDGLAALDIDHCRDTDTGSVAIWAQLMLGQALHSYCEITPSGTGLRIWGTGSGDRLHKKLPLDTGEGAAVELFRCTEKALTVTGLDLHQGRTLGSLDKLLHWTQVYAGRHKPEPKRAVAAPSTGFDSSGSKYTIEQIEDAVRTGTILIGSRSETFHVCVGHLHGCGWTAEQILEHMEQFPDGICERYLSEGRLSNEIDRSIRRFSEHSGKPQLDVKPWTGPWEPPQPEAEEDETLEEEDASPPWEEDEEPLEVEQAPAADAPDADEEDLLEKQELEPAADELDEDEEELELDEEELLEKEEEQPKDLQLPPLHYYGESDTRPLESWLIKGLMRERGRGLLSGQWGTYKTFVALDIAGAVMSGQPFLDCLIKRRCGVLFLAAEGEEEIRLRIEVLMAAKYGSPAEVPFLWYEAVPALLRKGAADLLVAMAEKANKELQKRFGLPLGLIILDTMTAAAGYTMVGSENDSAVCQQLMDTLGAAAPKLSCFCLGVDHFGKNPSAGTRGGSPKEDSAVLVLACLGDRDSSGQVINTRLAVRKCRGARSGYAVPFTVRVAPHPTERDDEGEVSTSLVIDWGKPGDFKPQKPQEDPWKQPDMKRLQRVLMSMLAKHGVSLAPEPDQDAQQMIDREIVRKEFFAQTAADGDEKQRATYRRVVFHRATGRAQKEGLIGIYEIDGITYFWLCRPDSHEEGDRES